ncbi:hypothetical protein BC781_10866 [Sediminitomix flava]|uniref:Uncharacterized protein n=1 Tax=Sediminitomix flava TaxID=379075 RepID=A0A315Z6E3_SEDFL|nr:hypothetical protein BC781_10866 [Sediminitomix flava]
MIFSKIFKACSKLYIFSTKIYAIYTIVIGFSLGVYHLSFKQILIASIFLIFPLYLFMIYFLANGKYKVTRNQFIEHIKNIAKTFPEVLDTVFFASILFVIYQLGETDIRSGIYLFSLYIILIWIRTIRAKIKKDTNKEIKSK